MLDQGGLDWCVGRSQQSSAALYGWAERPSVGRAVRGRSRRSARPSSAPSTSIGVDAPTVSSVLRANGIVDTDSYRKLGRNQLRIGMFPAIDPDDVEALTRCIDYVVERLAG